MSFVKVRSTLIPMLGVAALAGSTLPAAAIAAKPNLTCTPISASYLTDRQESLATDTAPTPTPVILSRVHLTFMYGGNQYEENGLLNQAVLLPSSIPEGTTCGVSETAYPSARKAEEVGSLVMAGYKHSFWHDPSPAYDGGLAKAALTIILEKYNPAWTHKEDKDTYLDEWALYDQRWVTKEPMAVLPIEVTFFFPDGTSISVIVDDKYAGLPKLRKLVQ